MKYGVLAKIFVTVNKCGVRQVPGLKCNREPECEHDVHFEVIVINMISLQQK